jgi:hypothetical protein
MLIIAGIALVAIGVALTLGGKLGLGRLPGDIVIERENFTFYLPITTSILGEPSAVAAVLAFQPVVPPPRPRR